MLDEIWRPIQETNGKYEVSNMGRVRNCSTNVIRKQKTLPNGYLQVCYMISRKTKYRYVHRLVADAFCIHPDNCNVINHIDNNQKNNNANNLEWTTQRENTFHTMRQGRTNGFPVARSVIGEKGGLSVKYDSAREASQKTGCDNSGIIKCCKGKLKKIKGYTWKFAEVV